MDLLIKSVSETIKDEAKGQKGGFLGVSLGALAARVLGNILAGKGVTWGEEGVIRAGEGVIKAGVLMLLLPLTNFEIEKCH